MAINFKSECPICGDFNECSHSLDPSLKNCWCFRESFPEEIFDLIPIEQLRKSCICKKCLDSFKQDKCKAGG